MAVFEIKKEHSYSILPTVSVISSNKRSLNFPATISGTEFNGNSLYLLSEAVGYVLPAKRLRRIAPKTAVEHSGGLNSTNNLNQSPPNICKETSVCTDKLFSDSDIVYLAQDNNTLAKDGSSATEHDPNSENSDFKAPTKTYSRTKKHTCLVNGCNFSTSYPIYLNRHMRKHKENVNHKPPTQRKKMPPTLNGTDDVHICGCCNQCFLDLNLFIEHKINGCSLKPAPITGLPLSQESLSYLCDDESNCISQFLEVIINEDSVSDVEGMQSFSPLPEGTVEKVFSKQHKSTFQLANTKKSSVQSSKIKRVPIKDMFLMETRTDPSELLLEAPSMSTLDQSLSSLLQMTEEFEVPTQYESSVQSVNTDISLTDQNNPLKDIIIRHKTSSSDSELESACSISTPVQPPPTLPHRTQQHSLLKQHKSQVKPTESEIYSKDKNKTKKDVSIHQKSLAATVSILGSDTPISTSTQSLSTLPHRTEKHALQNHHKSTAQSSKTKITAEGKNKPKHKLSISQEILSVTGSVNSSATPISTLSQSPSTLPLRSEKHALQNQHKSTVQSSKTEISAEGKNKPKHEVSINREKLSVTGSVNSSATPISTLSQSPSTLPLRPEKHALQNQQKSAAQSSKTEISSRGKNKAKKDVAIDRKRISGSSSVLGSATTVSIPSQTLSALSDTVEEHTLPNQHKSSEQSGNAENSSKDQNISKNVVGITLGTSSSGSTVGGAAPIPTPQPVPTLPHRTKDHGLPDEHECTASSVKTGNSVLQSVELKNEAEEGVRIIQRESTLSDTIFGNDPHYSAIFQGNALYLLSEAASYVLPEEVSTGIGKFSPGPSNRESCGAVSRKKVNKRSSKSRKKTSVSGRMASSNKRSNADSVCSKKQYHTLRKDINSVFGYKTGKNNIKKGSKPASANSTNEIRKHPCPVSNCPFATSYPKDLMRHMRKHTGEKPFHCDTCDKSFSRKDKLKGHLRFHFGERTFKCPLCHHATLDKSNLKKHMRVHTDERPFQCQLCPYASKRLTHLTVHLRTHTGDHPFVCEFESCASKFKTSSELNRHTRMHTGERPFSCDICGYRCAVKSNLIVHFRINHPIGCLNPCAICNYFPVSKKAAREHQKIHPGQWAIPQRKQRVVSKPIGGQKEKDVNKSSESKQGQTSDATNPSCAEQTLDATKPLSAGRTSNTIKPVSVGQISSVIKPICVKSFKCTVCDAAFVREDSWKSHMRQHQNQASSLHKYSESDMFASLQSYTELKEKFLQKLNLRSH